MTNNFTKDTLLKTCSTMTLVLGTASIIGASPAKAYQDAFYVYDTDNDGYIEETEYVSYSYDVIDWDNDGYISDDEWDYYTSVWYEPYDYNVSNSFTYYDTDNDGFIEIAEYNSAYDDRIYDSWDIDNDGYLETVEYNQLTNTYSTYDYDDVYTW